MMVYGDGTLNEELVPWYVYSDGKMDSQVEIIIEDGVEVKETPVEGGDPIKELWLLRDEQLSAKITITDSVKGFFGRPGFMLKIGGHWQKMVEEEMVIVDEPFRYRFTAWNTAELDNGTSPIKELDGPNNDIIENGNRAEDVDSFILFPTGDIEYWNSDKIQANTLLLSHRAPMKFFHNGALETFPRIRIPNDENDEPVSEPPKGRLNSRLSMDYGRQKQDRLLRQPLFNRLG